MMLAMRSLRPVTMKFFSLHSRFILVLLSVLSLRETTANDECVDAIVVSSFPVTFTGNTSQATVDFPDPTDNLRNLTCGIPATSAGIWYRLEGNNQFVKAQVTDIDTASFSTALFTNTCDDLQCLLASDYSLTNQRTQPTSEWFAQEGETYFLHVTSVGETPGGAFDLEIEQIPVGRPSNDRCETSTRFDGLPALAAGNSSGAWPIAFSSAANQECSVKESARGLYYSFEGIDGRVAIILTNLEILEDGRFEVALFSNDTCQECITFRDFLFDGNDHGFHVTLQAGTNYTLLVAGEGYSDVGTFDIDIKKNDDDAEGESSASKIATILAGILVILASGLLL